MTGVTAGVTVSAGVAGVAERLRVEVVRPFVVFLVAGVAAGGVGGGVGVAGRRSRWSGRCGSFFFGRAFDFGEGVLGASPFFGTSA